MASASLADKRRALAELARERSHSGPGSRRTAWIATGLVGLLVVPGLLWLAGFFSPPPAVQELRGLVDRQVEELRRAGRNEVAFATAEAGIGTVMEQMRDAPRELREQARAEIGRLFDARERAEIDSYFALPPEQRRTELDRRIKADEERRKTWEAERAKRAASAADRTNRGAGRGPPSPAASGGRTRRDGSEEGRNARSKAAIDRTTPEQRARRTEYRRAVEERRTQMGLGPSRR